jgi:WD repeat and SOF domain-containing protein 1
VRDAVVSPDGRKVLSCGDDKAARLWALSARHCTLKTEPEATYNTAAIPNAIDHHWSKNMFVTAGDTVDVWDYNRSAPLSSFEWGCERVITSRFNPAEPALIGSTAVDRSVGLYDLRGNSAIRKVILKMRSNAMAWNPMQPLNFTVANEDCNLYTFDMRNLTQAIGRHWDHGMAVLDVCYSPNGQEFLSASYDATVRLWNLDSQRSRDVYHTKRMQRVLCCAYSPDGRFVLSGSEDTNVRVWKAKSDQKLGVATDRERQAVAYREALKEKFQRLPEIARIKRHVHVPKMIKTITKKRQIMREARARKDENRRKHSKPGAHPHVKMKKRHVVKELE